MADMGLFASDEFNEITMTDAVSRIDHQPSLIRSMGLFEKQPSRTTGILIEMNTKTNTLVPVSDRGAPLTEVERLRRNIKSFETYRLAKASTVYATEVQNIRKFGTTGELEQLIDLVAEGTEQSDGDISLTEENMMLGCVQGIVVDSDGSTVLHNWFTEFGITPPTEKAFDFANATVAEVSNMILDIHTQMQDASKGLMYNEVVALCDTVFFKGLTSHEAYTGNSTNPVEALRLMDEYGRAYNTVSFGNITWINYRGSQSESSVAIGSGKVKFFPRGGRGLFKQGLGCAEFGEYVNTPGKERYVINIPDRDRNAWMKTEMYTYPLFYCTRPEMLLSGRAGA